MLEGAVMTAAGMPEAVWLPWTLAPKEFRDWIQKPRYVREVGAIYSGAERTINLHSLQTEFDGVVVIKTGRVSTPTPTGHRKAS